MDWVETDSLGEAYKKCLVHLEAGQTETAIKLLERLVERFPHADAPLSTLGYLYQQEGRLIAAVRSISRSVAETDKPFDIRNNLAFRTQIAFDLMDGKPINLETGPKGAE